MKIALLAVFASIALGPSVVAVGVARMLNPNGDGSGLVGNPGYLCGEFLQSYFPSTAIAGQLSTGKSSKSSKASKSKSADPSGEEICQAFFSGMFSGYLKFVSMAAGPDEVMTKTEYMSALVSMAPHIGLLTVVIDYLFEVGDANGDGVIDVGEFPLSDTTTVSHNFDAATQQNIHESIWQIWDALKNADILSKCDVNGDTVADVYEVPCFADLEPLGRFTMDRIMLFDSNGDGQISKFELDAMGMRNLESCEAYLSKTCVL